MDGLFSEVHRNQRLVGAIIQRFKSFELGKCISQCLIYLNCKSVNFLDYTTDSMQGTGTCELNSEECEGSVKIKLVSHKMSTYLQTPQFQLNVSDSNK